MTPYYQDDLVTIYHGDCREWMPEADAIVTDPPYGIDINPIRSRFARIEGDAEPFDPAFLLALGKPTVLFGANHYADLGGPVRSVRHYWNGGGSKAHENLGGSYHPTQKPVYVMAWILALTDGVVLDPFMGGGSTLMAAKLNGRRAIGIEIDEAYCEIAATRCSQEVLGLTA